jgi:Tfp pilus assembly major pilin PilA
MAATYTLWSKNTVFAANKCMMSIFNESASPVVIKLYRMYVLNNQYVAVTGVLTNLEVRKLSASAGGTALTAAPHDTTNTLNANVTCATNATVTPTDIYRRVLWSTDEPTANTTMTIDEFQCLLPFGCVWSMGYGESTVEPITLNAGEGVGLINTGAVVGQCDVIFEFTAT